MTLPNMLGFEPDPGAQRAPRAWPRFMTARVAADYADSSAWTIRRHVRPCGRRGRTFVYAIEAIEEWMRGELPAKREDVLDGKARRPATGRLASLRGDLAKRDLGAARVDEQKDDVAA